MVASQLPSRFDRVGERVTVVGFPRAYRKEVRDSTLAEDIGQVGVARKPFLTCGSGRSAGA